MAYIKTKLPKVSNKDDNDAKADCVKAFSLMVQRLMMLDKKTEIYQ
jgi:hypothetical protein